MDNLKIGDIVKLSYFGIVHKGEVIKITPTKVRIQFRNCRGQIKEAWRKRDRKQVTKDGKFV